ncbi:MAG: hypothetical protein K5Q68_12810 [Roseococcus sp.]|nr:hypothetical protein [Roseococcus sp.]
MTQDLIWPKREREIDHARADVADLIATTSPEAVAELEAKVTDAVRGQPMGLVLAALAMALGRASAERFGPLAHRPFALVAVAVQITWRTAADMTPKH